MKIFEFQFNPRARKDRFFKTFSFERALLGKDFSSNVYAAGELANVLPQNSDFLDKIAHLLSEEYQFQKKDTANPENVFKKGVQSINHFLTQELKQGNVDWLGNLNLLLIAFSFFPKQRRVMFSLAKCGTIQLFLARKSKLVPLAYGSTLENIVGGKLLPQDKLIVATQELFSLLQSRNLLLDLAFLKEEKQYRELFKQKEKELLKVAGILITFLVEELPPKLTPKRNQPALWTLSPSSRKRIVLIGLLYLVLMVGSLLFQ